MKTTVQSFSQDQTDFLFFDFFIQTLKISNRIKSEINYWINSLNEMWSDELLFRSTWLNEHFAFFLFHSTKDKFSSTIDENFSILFNE